MFYQAINPVANTALCDALLAALSAIPGATLMVTPHVRLFTNQFQPVGRTPLATFTEATFTGYAAVVLPTLTGPVTLPSAQEALMADVNYIAGAVTPPGQVAYGWYITDNTPTVWYWAEQFTVPIPFVALGNFLDLKVVLPEPTQRSTQ